MTNTFQSALPASLIRRLAEAADGFRNIDSVYFIAAYEFPHPLKDFPHIKAAKDYFAEKGFSENEYGIFGPFTTNDDLKDHSTIEVENIEKVDLTIHYKDGHQQSTTLQGCMDSIFFNLSSFEKFVFPYYCQVYGVEYAKILRDNLISQSKEFPKAEHIHLQIRQHYCRTYMHHLYKKDEFPE